MPYAAERREVQKHILHALDGLELVSQCSDSLDFAGKNDHFQAMMMVQMGMERRDDHSASIMLDIGQLVEQIAFMMVVDERDVSSDMFVLLPLMVLQGGSHQVFYSLGTGGIATFTDEPVKMFEKIPFQGDPEPH
jgi:hypothetical protein